MSHSEYLAARLELIAAYLNLAARQQYDGACCDKEARNLARALDSLALKLINPFAKKHKP